MLSQGNRTQRTLCGKYTFSDTARKTNSDSGNTCTLANTCITITRQVNTRDLWPLEQRYTWKDATLRQEIQVISTLGKLEEYSLAMGKAVI